MQEVEDYQKLIKLLASHDVLWLPAILLVVLWECPSVCKITPWVQAAISSNCTPLGKFSNQEIDLALVSLQLGGYWLLYTLQEAFGLPSLCTVMQKHVCLTIIASML